MLYKISKIFIYIFALIGFILIIVYLAIEFEFTKTSGIIDNQHDYFKNQMKKEATWQNSEEWLVLKEAIKKDTEIINKVSKEAGISSRIIVSVLIVEQLRLFYSEREIFKEVFAPLKILANQSQFSWGIMGIKQDTAIQIEENLKNSTSPWYLGKDYENILDFNTNNPNKERFEKLTNEKDRYYSYLYAAILIKEIEKQWENANFSINDKPGIIATLFNIGFTNSKPNANPQFGGAEIEIYKTTYSFGGLAQSFYDSKELIEEFPISSPL